MMFNDYIQEVDKADVEASYMKTRLLTTGNTEGVSIKDLGPVWNYSDVRKIWARQQLVLMEPLIGMQEVFREYQKGLMLVVPNWDTVNALNANIQKEFFNGFNENDRHAFQQSKPFSYEHGGTIYLIGNQGRDAIPELGLLTFQQADSITRDVQLLQVSLRTLFYAIDKGISHKSAMNTFYYRIIYGLGSVLVVASFLIKSFRTEAVPNWKKRH